ncbi:MAG: hypothetical protein IH614_06470 [Desulfuromonadales bacterium]|nr:hypothetical protein [Desulfuromonadales bacterium]
MALLPALGLLLLLSGCSDDTPAVLAPSTAEASLPAEFSAPQPPQLHPPSPAVLAADESTAAPELDADPGERRRYKAGEDPEFARQCGWPVAMPEPLPGALLPAKRLVAYYGNPNSRRMGVLGEYDKEEMLSRLLAKAKAWEEADPAVPVQPALHLVAVVAQGTPGKAGKYRMIMPDAVVNRVYEWAQEVGAVLFVDIQPGHDDIRALLPRFEWILQHPDVHLGIDPEFNMGAGGNVPGTKIGSIDADDINYAADYLAELVRRHNLPPKVFVVHRFTRRMVTNASEVKLRPEVQVVMHMDGWGASWLKRDTYKDYIVKEPVQYAGFKLFYHNDTKKGDPLMHPDDVLRLQPQPLYIQYQ